MADLAQMESLARVGDVLAGKYRVERVIGVGGMGIVVAATHIELEERVALKLLLPDVASDPSAVLRFVREARASVRIKSEHVARTFDVGRLENGSPFIVMEFLEGTDLANRIARHGPVPITDAVEYIIQALDAVAEAHLLGIIHRDIKPANLFVVTQPDGVETVKVLDFGISKMSGGTAIQMTQTSAMMGSPYYMSPEQMESATRVDARSDIWALGVTLFELLCAEVPFGGNTLPEVCLRVINQPVPSLQERRVGVPEALVRVVERCLEKRPEDRYANVGELALALAPFCSPRGQYSAQRVTAIVGRRLRSDGSRGDVPSTCAAVGKPLGPQADSACGGSDRTLCGHSPPIQERGEGATAAPWSQTSSHAIPLSSRSLAMLGSLGLAVVVGGGAWWWLGAKVTPRVADASEPDRPIEMGRRPKGRAAGTLGVVDVTRMPVDPGLDAGSLMSAARLPGQLRSSGLGEADGGLARSVQSSWRSGASRGRAADAAPAVSENEALAPSSSSRPSVSGQFANFESEAVAPSSSSRPSASGHFADLGDRN